jgi:phage terminase small subunit
MPRGRKPIIKPTKDAEGGGSLSCPEWLNPEGRAEWQRVAPTLTKKGVLKPT